MLEWAAPARARTSDVVIGPWSHESLGMMLAPYAANGVGAWPAAGLVLYIPFWVPAPVTVTRVNWYNGTVAGNVDAGIYDESGVLLVSAGTTAVSGANSFQGVDLTNTVIQRGRYYMAMVADTVTTLTIGRAGPSAGLLQAWGMLQQASVTLPLSTGASPATFAICTTAYVPLLGFTTRRDVAP